MARRTINQPKTTAQSGGLAAIVAKLGIPENIRDVLGDQAQQVLEGAVMHNPQAVFDFAIKSEHGTLVGQDNDDLLQRVGHASLEKDPGLALKVAEHFGDRPLARRVEQKLLQSEECDVSALYRAAVLSGDKRLLHLARQAIVYYDVEEAYSRGRVDGDTALVDMARKRLVDEQPSDAYDLGVQFKDTVLLAIVRPIFAVVRPSEAYQVGVAAKDKRLQRLAFPELLQDDPRLAYTAARTFRSERLLRQARKAYADDAPEQAYKQAVKSKDKKLRELASAALLREDNGLIFTAYDIAKQFNDSSMLFEALPRFAKADPEEAYKVAIQRRDFSLATFAIDQLAKQHQLTANEVTAVRQLYRYP
ncbi:hypothetical protein HYU19_05980 [Candidatus Woesearchaeota archaeon]|nr:hypothetical protein [Candidatus Woesearchaeota archaeon]